MVESIMYFGAGFLVAGVLALALISFVHRRAVRLTLRRVEDAVPVSLAEIQADKDKLRAQFAMSARRLETTVEQLKAKATNQLGELARKSEAIAKLKAQLAEKTAVADELDARSRSLSVRVHESEQDHAVRSAAVGTTERALAAKEAELAKAAAYINELTFESETQKVEIALLKTQIEQFKSRISELELNAEDAARRLFDERVAVSTVNKALEEKSEAQETWRTERAENDLLRERIADIAAQVAHMSMDKAGSPMAAILKETASMRPAGFERVANSGDGRPPEGSLTDRIRKLQNATSRVFTAS
jgi:chromosome segregation ATPase